MLKVSVHRIHSFVSWRTQEKFAVVGLTEGNPLLNVVAFVTGALKFSVPLNAWFLKSRDLAKKQFYISIPGFALVIYAHRMVEEPLSNDVACVVFPAILALLAFDESGSDDEKSKSK